MDAFWSVTVYNAEGYLEANDRNIYSYNGVTAEANPDGSFTLHLGGCDDGRVNCIPITPGWNYATRMYAPREEILSGEWDFPEPAPITWRIVITVAPGSSKGTGRSHYRTV